MAADGITKEADRFDAETISELKLTFRRIACRYIGSDLSQSFFHCGHQLFFMAAEKVIRPTDNL
jgi:hypothetical protein